MHFECVRAVAANGTVLETRRRKAKDDVPKEEKAETWATRPSAVSMPTGKYRRYDITQEERQEGETKQALRLVRLLWYSTL